MTVQNVVTTTITTVNVAFPMSCVTPFDKDRPRSIKICLILRLLKLRASSIIVSISHSIHTLNFHDENSTFYHARLNSDRRTDNIMNYNFKPTRIQHSQVQTWHVCTLCFKISQHVFPIKRLKRAQIKKILFFFFLFFGKSFFQIFSFFTDYRYYVHYVCMAAMFVDYFTIHHLTVATIFYDGRRRRRSSSNLEFSGILKVISTHSFSIC